MIAFLALCIITLSFGAASADPIDVVEDVAFVKIGEYKGENYEKVYYTSRHFQALWTNTRSVCKAYGMDVLSLETLEEANNFLALCQQNAQLFDRWTHVGAITLAPRFTHSWYWVNSGKRITYPLNFMPGQPDNAYDKEWCLSIGKESHEFFFNDINCYRDYEEKFVCQKYNLTTTDTTETTDTTTED